jgi:hypothetical protein
MRVTSLDIQKKFDSLIMETDSRESIADFAKRAMEADDCGSLEIEPPLSSEVVWKAITYLSGVDLMVAPDQYLHSIEDFSEYRVSLKF